MTGPYPQNDPYPQNRSYPQNGSFQEYGRSNISNQGSYAPQETRGFVPQETRGFAPQEMRGYDPPQNYPPQYHLSQNLPSQDFPFHNFSSQHIPSRNFPPQHLPSQNLPPQLYQPSSSGSGYGPYHSSYRGTAHAQNQDIDPNDPQQWTIPHGNSTGYAQPLTNGQSSNHPQRPHYIQTSNHDGQGSSGHEFVPGPERIPTFALVADSGGNGFAANSNTRDQVTLNTEARRTIIDLFPQIPQNDLNMIIEHSYDLEQGRVGTNDQLSPVDCARISVRAHVRHVHTRYNHLLRTLSRDVALSQVSRQMGKILAEWRGRRRRPRNRR